MVSVLQSKQGWDGHGDARLAAFMRSLVAVGAKDSFEVSGGTNRRLHGLT